jgi:hypothetical protein
MHTTLLLADLVLVLLAFVEGQRSSNDSAGDDCETT